MAANGLFCRGLGASMGMGSEGLYARGLFGAGAGVATDNDTTPPHFRDAQYRNRLSWGLMCLLLILCV